MSAMLLPLALALAASPEPQSPPGATVVTAYAAVPPSPAGARVSDVPAYAVAGSSSRPCARPWWTTPT
jgi:hypothetical protein